MSNVGSPTIKYKCPWDCDIGGCPGHKLRLIYHLTSDTVSVKVDGEMLWVFSSEQLNAIVKAAEFGKLYCGGCGKCLDCLRIERANAADTTE